jgi:hypothetical protein
MGIRKTSTLIHKYASSKTPEDSRKLQFINLSLEQTEQQHNIFIAKYNQRKPQLIRSGVVSSVVTVSSYFALSYMQHTDTNTLIHFIALAGVVISGAHCCGSIFAHSHLLSAHTAFNTYMQHKRGLNLFAHDDDKLDSLLDQLIHYID